MKQYFDPETRKMVTAEEIAREYYESQQKEPAPRREWVKLRLRSLSLLNEAIDSPRFRLLVWIFRNVMYGDNTFSGNMRYISKETDISYSTVRKIIHRFMDADCVRETPDGRMMINPAVVHAGSEGFGEWLAERFLKLKYTPKTPASESDQEKEENDGYVE